MHACKTVDLAPEERIVLERLLGRQLADDEIVNVSVVCKPETPMSFEQWEHELEALIDTFPQRPLLSDEAISRESIYSREDDLGR